MFHFYAVPVCKWHGLETENNLLSGVDVVSLILIGADFFGLFCPKFTLSKLLASGCGKNIG